jgi:transposase
MHSTMKSVEVITRVERRRRWSPEEKKRLVAQSARADRMVSQVARAHGIAPNLLFTWRRQFLAAAVEEEEHPSALCRLSWLRKTPATQADGTALPAAGPRLEIRLASGIVISVIGEVASESLRRVLSVLSAG